MVMTAEGKYTKEHRREYQAEYRLKKKKEKEQARLMKGSNGDGDWGEFQEHVKKLAMEKGAKSPVMVIYKEMLKLNREKGKGGVLSADERARRNKEAERELREGGYIT